MRVHLGNCQQTRMVGAKGMCVKMVGVEPEEKQEACHHGRCIERIGSCHEGQGEPRWDFWQRITCGEIWNKQLGDWQDEPDKKQGASERGRVCQSSEGATTERAWLLHG